MSIKKQFIKEFCNDHAIGKVRWLRGVALDNQDLLDKILEWLENQDSKTK